MAYLRDIAAFAVLLITIIMVSWAVRSPEEFGKWLQAIDNARYEYTMCE